jgi:hypothetical protein
MKVLMKALARLATITGLLIGNPVTAANLLLNPGFETGDTTSWLPLGQGVGASITVQSGINGSGPGTFALLMSNTIPANTLALQQTTALGDAVPGLMTSFYLDAKFISTNGAFSAHIWDLDSTGGVIDGHLLGPLSPFISISFFSTYGISYIAPANVDHFKIEIDCTTGASGAEVVFIDNVTVTPIPEPASLSLVAMGLLSTWALRRSLKA